HGGADAVDLDPSFALRQRVQEGAVRGLDGHPPSLPAGVGGGGYRGLMADVQLSSTAPEPPRPTPLRAETPAEAAVPAPGGRPAQPNLERPILDVSPDAPDRWIDRLVVFDLETTGVDPTEARIVTAYVGVLDATGTVVEERSWIVDPGVEIPEGSIAVHGVTT